MRMLRRWFTYLLLLASGLPTACSRPSTLPSVDPPPEWFEDVTDKVGLDFVHDGGEVNGKYFMPQIVGSGAAFLDFDKDGLLDLYLLQNGGEKGACNRLYRQRKDGRFQDVSKGSGLDIAGFNMGVAVADVNNDGWPDVLVTQFGGVRLFLNNGDSTFQDVTAAAGLHNPHWGSSAAFFDYDRDGWLDLILVIYVDYDPTHPCKNPSGEQDYCGPSSSKGRVSKLFHNLGPQPVGSKGPRVRFEDVSAASGIGLVPGPGLGVVCADFDADGWIDVFIANDGKPNHLWINQKNGTFKEEGVRRGVAVNAMGNAEANMGIGWGDVDGDGLQDLFVTHLSNETNTLWKQWRPGLFRDATAFSRLNRPRWTGTGFGAVLGDFNQDGNLDVALVNGRVSKDPERVDLELGEHWGKYAERNQFFAGDGKGKFDDISQENPSFCRRLQLGRGLAMADFDRDGSLDLLVMSINSRARLFKNVAPKRGHWLMVRAWDGKHQRDALAADVIVRSGEQQWIRTVNPAGSFLCSNGVHAHFGLGSIDHIDSIEIRWPDGQREEFTDPVPAFEHGKVDRVVLLEQGRGRECKNVPPRR